MMHIENQNQEVAIQVAKKGALLFIGLTFLITYTAWLAFMVAHFKTGIVVFGDSPLGLLMILGLFSPTLVGMGLKLKDRKLSLSWKLWGQGTMSSKVKYLFLAVLLPLAFVALESGIPSPLVPAQVAVAFLMSIIFGGLEELGWRSYLLPLLLKFLTPTKANLVVALVWVLWHIPLFFLPGTAQYQENFLIFACSLASLSSLMTYIWIKTESPLLAILIHTIYNALASLGATTDNTLSQLLISAAIATASIALLHGIMKRDIKKQDLQN